MNKSIILVIIIFLAEVYFLYVKNYFVFSILVSVFSFYILKFFIYRNEFFIYHNILTYLLAIGILFFLSLEHLFYILSKKTSGNEVLKKFTIYLSKVTSLYYFRQISLYGSIVTIFIFTFIDSYISNISIENKEYVYIFLIFLVFLLGIKYVFDQKINIKRYDFTSDKINNNIKIIHLSDSHNEIYTNKFLFGKEIYSNELLIDLVIKEKPDLIVMSGDMFDEVSDFYKSDSIYKELNKIAPMFYTIGNHETSTLGKKQEYLNEMINDGVTYLQDTHEIININNEVIVIAGLKDPNSSNVLSEIRLANIEKNIEDDFKNNLKLLISHRPELIDEYKNSSFDFVFSGHAHGGQIIIPFINRGVIAPHQGFFPKYIGGFHKLNENTTLVISRGLKISGVPRMFNPPEVIVLNIKGK